jgi:hypothetical protein
VIKDDEIFGFLKDSSFELTEQAYIVRWESRCTLSLRHVDLVQACINAREHHLQQLLLSPQRFSESVSAESV